MAAHDLVPPPEILARLQGVLSTLEDHIRWQVVRARHARTLADPCAQRVEGAVVSSCASLWRAIRDMADEIREQQRRDAEYREACNRG